MFFDLFCFFFTCLYFNPCLCLFLGQEASKFCVINCNEFVTKIEPRAKKKKQLNKKETNDKILPMKWRGRYNRNERWGKIGSVKENKGSKDRVRHFTLLDIIGVAFFLPTFASFEKSTVWHSVRKQTAG